MTYNDVLMTYNDVLMTYYITVFVMLNSHCGPIFNISGNFNPAL